MNLSFFNLVLAACLSELIQLLIRDLAYTMKLYPELYSQCQVPAAGSRTDHSMNKT